MKKALVIGSNSFSGSDFVDLLLEKGGYEIVGVSRSPEKGKLFLPYQRHHSPFFHFHQVDLNHDLAKLTAIIDEFKPSYVINFAAQSEVGPSWANPDHWFQTNAVALTRLVHGLKDKQYIQKYVHISSPEVYGTCEGNITEEAPLNPSTPYAASKAAGDLSLFTYFKNFNLPLAMIRATNVYGAYQQLFKIIPRSIIYIKKGQVIELHGGGSAIKSYIHIRDVSRGTLSVMEEGKAGQIYHFSPDQGITVKEVVQTICRKMGVSFDHVTRVAPERLGQDKAYVIDSGKARSLFSWKPQITLDEGVEQTVQWIEGNFAEILQNSLEYIHKA